MNKAKLPACAPIGVLTVDMKKKRAVAKEETIRVTGNITLKRACGKGDERQIYRHTKKENLMGDGKCQPE